MSRPLVVIALPAEGQGLFEAAGVPVLYTGVGKINAAYALTRELLRLRSEGTAPSLVVNFGTAGSRTFDTGAVVACRRFVQRDMDATGLGFALGETPFDDAPLTIEHPRLFTQLPEGVCGSGDRFETTGGGLACDVVDMEAYALAKICHREQVAFGCVKYVTDGHDQEAAVDWTSNLPRAAQAFIEAYRRLFGG